MKSLGWEAIVQNCDDDKTKLVEFINKVAEWKVPLNLSLTLQLFSSMQEDAHKNYQKLCRYEQSIADYYAAVAAGTQSALDAWRSSRGHDSLAMRAVGVPAPLAKRAADLKQSKLDGSQPCAIHFPAMSPPTADEDMALTFRSPVCVPFDPVADTNPFQKACSEWSTQNQAVLEERTSFHANECCERAANHSHHMMEVEKVSAFPFGAGGCPIQTATGVNAMLHMIRNYVHDGRDLVWPWAFQRVDITSVIGTLFVCVLEPELARKAINVDSFLQQAHHSALSNCPIYSLSPGDSLVLPLGTRPLFLAYMNDIKKPGELEVPKMKKTSPRLPQSYSSFVVSLPFDSTSDRTQSPEAKVSALKAYVGALNWIPSRIRGLPHVNAWKKALEQVTLPSAEVAQADAAAMPSA